MKYERLTSTYTTEDGEKISAYINPRTYAVYVSETIFRLAELENKIERGELISTVQAEQGDQEVAFFVAHNAAVRQQAVKEFADKIITSSTTVYDPLRCTEFIKLPMERYEKLLKEVCGE